MGDGMASVGRDTAQTVLCAPFVLGVAPGAIVAGFDVHRRQITFDALDTVTGEVWRGQLESTPAAVEQWVDRFPGRVVHVAVEACTGWLFVCRALGACRRGRAPGRAGGDQRAARPQAPRQDRPRGREVAAPAAVRGAAAGGLVPARACAPVALARAAAQHAARRAHQLDPADPRDALSPRCRRRPG